MVKMIACIDKEGNIGKDNDLLFHMKEDMNFFRKSTMGSIVVMGYNTWLSLGEKSLPNRKNIVLTDVPLETVETSTSLEQTIWKYEEENDIYIIGGAYVYNYALANNLINEILITIVPVIVADADTKICMELTKDFNNKEILKTFENNYGLEVTIEKWTKI